MMHRLRLAVLSCSIDSENCELALSIAMGLNLNTYSPLVKLNQKNIGTIRLSNLGTEIVKYSAPDEVAVVT